jgi:hypothetical protein
MCPSVPPLER